MFKLYKIIFVSDIDSKTYSVYCNKNNLPKILERITQEDTVNLIFFLPILSFTFENFKKCLTNYTNYPLSQQTTPLGVVFFVAQLAGALSRKLGGISIIPHISTFVKRFFNNFAQRSDPKIVHFATSPAVPLCILHKK